MKKQNKIILAVLIVVAVGALIFTSISPDLFQGRMFKFPPKSTKTIEKVVPVSVYVSKPMYIRLYERGGEEDPGTANRIIIDHPFGAGWDNMIALNRIADADQTPPVTSVGFDVEKESGYEYVVLALNEDRDIDFGRVLYNLKLTQINEADGYVVISLIRK